MRKSLENKNSWSSSFIYIYIYICIYDTNMIISVTVDGLALIRARPSTGTTLITTLQMIFSSFTRNYQFQLHVRFSNDCHFEWRHLINQNVVEIVGEASAKHHGTSRFNDTFTCISHHHSHCIYHTHYQVLSQYTLVSSSSSSPALPPINRLGYWQYGLVRYRTPTWGSHGKYQCSPIWQPKLWGQKPRCDWAGYPKTGRWAICLHYMLLGVKKICLLRVQQALDKVCWTIEKNVRN